MDILFVGRLACLTGAAAEALCGGGHKVVYASDDVSAAVSGKNISPFRIPASGAELGRVFNSYNLGIAVFFAQGLHRREPYYGEYQELEIELAEKRLKEYAAAVKAKKALLEETEGIVADRKADLEVKQGELKSIEEETASQVAEFGEQADVAKAKIDERLLAAYNRIRSNVHNGLAVVTVKRDACGGCFNRIPPQRQADIRQGKKIIICEYCGRILVADPDGAEE